MDLLKKIKYRIKVLHNKLLHKKALECIRQYSIALYSEAYICSSELYPENKLSTNVDLAIEVRKLILDDKGVSSEVSEQVEIIYLKLVNDDVVRQIISKHFTLRDFFIYKEIREFYPDESVSSEMLVAVKYNASAVKIDSSELAGLNSFIKNHLAILQRRLKAINSAKLLEEKKVIVKPVKITSSHVGFVASIFTTLFVLSGFLYNKLFFAYFGLAVSDFFTVSDYLGSSVDVISVTFIATMIGVGSYFYGMNEALNTEIHNNQFEVKDDKKSERHLLFAITVVPIIVFIDQYFRDDKIFFHALYFPVLILFFRSFYKLQIWDYIENKHQVSFFIIVVFIFTLNLALTLATKIQRIVSTDYSAPYALKFSEQAPDMKGYDYIFSNSAYVFMRNNETSNMKVVLKSEVVSFTSK